MKNIVSILVASLLIVGLTQAQERRNRQDRTVEEVATSEVERLTKELSLNKGQQDSIYKYTLLSGKEQRLIMQNNGSNREANFEKFRSIREANILKIKSFLNDEQLKKYDELQKNRPQRR